MNEILKQIKEYETKLGEPVQLIGTKATLLGYGMTEDDINKGYWHGHKIIVSSLLEDNGRSYAMPVKQYYIITPRM